MPIKISIDIGNRCQSIHTQIRLIDWSSISEINRLIEIDWYRLSVSPIDYDGLRESSYKSCDVK